MNNPAESRQLVLVRHGETLGNSSVRYHGRTDVALSELGREQIRAAARWLREYRGLHNFAPVFTSTLARAVESARIIAGPDAALIELADFAEVDFGIFEGLTADEIRERHPDEFALWRRDRLAPHYAYPGGESRHAFTARVERGIELMLARLDREWHSDAQLINRHNAALVVGHRGVIRAIIRRLTGIEPHIELASIHMLQRADVSHWQPVELDILARC
jgi:broad specificity phosphatase PhoE